MFMATEGHLHLTLWPDLSGRWSFIKPLYTDEEKEELLQHGLNALDVRRPSPRPPD
jgi:hypothetical protein